MFRLRTFVETSRARNFAARHDQFYSHAAIRRSPPASAAAIGSIACLVHAANSRLGPKVGPRSTRRTVSNNCSNVRTTKRDGLARSPIIMIIRYSMMLVHHAFMTGSKTNSLPCRGLTGALPGLTYPPMYEYVLGGRSPVIGSRQSRKSATEKSRAPPSRPRGPGGSQKLPTAVTHVMCSTSMYEYMLQESTSQLVMRQAQASRLLQAAPSCREHSLRVHMYSYVPMALPGPHTRTYEYVQVQVHRCNDSNGLHKVATGCNTILHNCTHADANVTCPVPRADDGVSETFAGQLRAAAAAGTHGLTKSQCSHAHSRGAAPSGRQACAACSSGLQRRQWQRPRCPRRVVDTLDWLIHHASWLAHMAAASVHDARISNLVASFLRSRDTIETHTLTPHTTGWLWCASLSAVALSRVWASSRRQRQIAISVQAVEITAPCVARKDSHERSSQGGQRSWTSICTKRRGCTPATPSASVGRTWPRSSH